MEIHELKTTVRIDSVKLNVRFPGQLSFQFKNAHLYQDMNEMYPLVNGECNVGKSVSFTSEVVYNPKKDLYKDISVDLSVSINTTSGKIVAGVVAFNPIQNTEDNLSLKRCSDKNASVAVKISFEKLRKLKDIEGESQKQIPESPIQQIMSARSNLITAKTKIKMEQQKSSNKSSHIKGQTFVSPNKDLKIVGSRIQEIEEKNEKKVKQLNQQKKELQDELEKARQKWRLADRREKDSQNVLKQLKDSNEKKRVKIVDLESKQIENEKAIFQSEKKTKQLQFQLKSAKDQLEQLLVKVSSLEKKLEVKQQNFAERQKKLTEKLSQVQSTNSKGLQDYNSLIEKMQAQQKANQATLKSKEKNYIQEKLKWKQQFDLNQQEIAILKSKNQQFLAKINLLTEREKELTLRTSQLESQLDKSRILIQNQKSQAERQKFSKDQAERELALLQGVESDKATLKKKFNQFAQENQKLKDKYDKLTLDFQELKENAKISEDSLQQLRKEKKSFLAKISELQKNNGNYEKEAAKYQIEVNNLSSKNTFLNERLNDCKTKMEQREKQIAEDEINANNTINSIIQSKQYLEIDLEDLRWALEKEKEKIAEVEKKLKEKSQIILNQEQDSLKLQKEIDHFKVREEEYHGQIQSLKEELKELKRKQRQNQELIKEKELKSFQQLKKLAELEQQSFLNSSKLKSSNSQKDEMIIAQLNSIKELTQELSDNKVKISQLQRQFQELEDRNRQTERKLKLQGISLEETEKLRFQAQNKCFQLKKQSDLLKKTLEECEQKKSSGEKESDQKIASLTKQLQQNEKQLKSKQADIQSYKKAVQQLLLIVSSDKENSDQVFVVPDSNLAKNQLEALLTRNKNISRFNQSIQELQVEINYLEKENENKAKILHEKEEKLEKTTKNHSEKIASVEQLLRQEKAQLNISIEKLTAELENMKTEKQKLEVKLKGTNQLLLEEQSHNEQLESEYEKAKQSIKSLEAKILAIRQRQINKKSEDETFIHNMKVQLKGEVQLYKEKLSLLLKEKEAQEKVLADRQKSIASNKNKISQLENAKAKLEETVDKLKAQGKSKDDQKGNIEQKLQQQKLNNAHLQESINKIQAQLTREIELKGQLEGKLKESREQLSQLSIAKEALLHKFTVIQQTSTTTGEEMRAKIILLEENLQVQAKKFATLFQKSTNLANEISMKSFEVKQLEQKVKQTQSIVDELRRQNETKRNQIVNLEKRIQQFKTKMMETEKQKSQYSLEKGAIGEELDQLKQKMSDYQSEIKQLNEQIQSLSSILQIRNTEYDNLKKEKNSLSSLNSQLKQALASAKKDVQLNSAKAAELKSRLGVVQDQLKEKQQYYQANKAKNWDQSQKQIGGLKAKLKKAEQEMKKMKQQNQKSKEELLAQIDTLENQKQELQGMLEQRESLIQQQEEEILAGQNRIIGLNGELRNCLEAWEKEKALALPSRKQASKIEQDLMKFHDYASDLDKKNKQALKIMGTKAKQEMFVRMGQQLVELLDLQQRSKLKILNSISQQDKEVVTSQYDNIRQKIQELLKNQKGDATNDS